ncbi:MAG: pyrroline-5-carboxylate reductase [Planctomycetota bacterium]
MTEITQILGFVGAGRMATALGRGCVSAELVEGRQVLAADPSEEALQRLFEQVPGARRAEENRQLLAESDIVVLAVKPQVMPSVLTELAPHAEDRHLFVSIAAGITTAALAEGLPNGKIVRVMPNTPCLVGFGASCFSLGRGAGTTESALVAQLLTSVGSATEVDEPLLDAVTGLSGSGPAFVYTAIEALAAGGTDMGLSPELALQLATETARGAAEMLRVTGSSPEELRHQVTSPGGTTLAGLERLGELAGADALRAAVEAATKRSIELGRS